MWHSGASFFDVGTPAEYLRTVHAVAARLGRPLDRGVGTQVDASAEISGTVLWDHVRVGAGASLRECVIADGVTVPPGTRLARSTVVQRGTRTPVAGDLTLDQLVIVPFAAAAG